MVLLGGPSIPTSAALLTVRGNGQRQSLHKNTRGRVEGDRILGLVLLVEGLWSFILKPSRAQRKLSLMPILRHVG